MSLAPSSTTMEQDIEKLRAIFEEERQRFSSARKSFSCLVLGNAGVGKTTFAATAPKPILIHSFDPGGSLSLRQQQEEDPKGLMIDNRFEQEDWRDPKAYRLWEKQFQYLYRAGVFDHIGTYVLDSLTSWSAALMYAILKENGRATGSTGKGSRSQPAPASRINLRMGKGSMPPIPQQPDYNIQFNVILRELGRICGLPCNFIGIGHLMQLEDAVTGKVTSAPLFYGRRSGFPQKVPQLFDEVYVMDVKQSSRGIIRQVHTQPTIDFSASSRLAGKGLLDAIEEPDFKAILEKAGYPIQDRVLEDAQEEATT